MNVLVVDDSRTVRRILASMMQPCGVTVLEAGDGQHALAVLNHHPVAAVFTDIHMPIMDGVELVRAIRREPRWETIGVCVVSSDTTRGQVARALLAGADDYLMKPVHADDITALVHRYTHRPT